MSNVSLGSTPLIGKMNKIGTVLAALGAVGLGAVFALNGQERFFADYLLGYWFFAGISVTMVFFSALQFLARAGWSSAIRRIAENFTGMVPFLAIGIIPIIYNLMSHHSIYEWSHASAATDPIIQKKAAYLNTTAFMIRMAVYAIFWIWMHRFVVGNSLKQDASASDITPTRKNWKRAAPWVLVYALSITFASFDLLMSLEPHWFSTIWGVYTFAGHFVGALAIVTIMTVALYNNGHLREYITPEHFHDLGKLMFAFSVFWTYIAFSQYFIIWYANLPEETIYFATRNMYGWEHFGVALVILHFVVPFMVLLRQDVKRKTRVLVVAAAIILLSHFLDLAYIIMPAVSKHAIPDAHGHVVFGWQEFTGWMFFAGIFMIMAVRQYAKNNAVAINDPLIHEAVEYTS
jgi:hypothetical protein